MIKLLGIIATIVITSLYFFPFEFSFLPGINTKMILAAFSLVILCFQLPRERHAMIDKGLFNLSFIAGMVSLISLAAVIINDTNDLTYASYIISMFVWLGGAYCVLQCIQLIHGRQSVSLVCNYLIVVCVLQCIIAYVINVTPSVKSFVDDLLGGSGFMGKNENRLYGIGAALDVSGSRFSVVLFMIGYLMLRIAKNNRWLWEWWYLIAFLIIAIIGNMMARTTIIGLFLTLFYVMYKVIFSLEKACYMSLAKRFIPFLVICIPCIAIIYNIDLNFRENFRFAFEGFFSLIERGKWEVHSNEILNNMYVFPESLRTWFIGDGYFNNPYYSDPYYVGPQYGGFYMGTDVGYLRFIFYFGLVGLSTFIYYFYRCASICIQRFSCHKTLFLFILLTNYIIWFKVSTDLFLVFSLFLVMKGDTESEQYKHPATIES